VSTPATRKHSVIGWQKLVFRAALCHLTAGQHRQVAVAGAVDENFPTQSQLARLAGDPDSSHDPLLHFSAGDHRVQQAGDSVRLQHFVEHELHLLIIESDPVLG
jgi:hypothetical protein